MKYPNIEAERARLGLSKTAFTESLGVSRQTYLRWIAGERPIPSNLLVKMADMTNSKTDYLLSREDK